MKCQFHEKGQEHFQRFTELIKIELEDETAMVEERWKKWRTKTGKCRTYLVG